MEAWKFAEKINDSLKLLLCIFLVVSCFIRLKNADAGGFDLRINDVSGLDEPWPLVGGLPFPEGELHDPSRIRIIGAEGQEVPAQIDVTATWRDGSIRWALAGFAASPQGEFRVEYGPGVTRSEPDIPLVLEQKAHGMLVVDTGAAVYEFLPDRLLPETARLGDTVFLANAGDGAYLVDNRGRLSRVSGASAGIETEVLKQGPVHTVLRREGWYVTEDGEQVARARVWLYFTAGTPAVRITHSLVFTEDTNEIWVRDYGLQFKTPGSPQAVTFAMREAGEEKLVDAVPDGDEVYLLQETYPYLLEEDSRAVVGRRPAGSGEIQDAVQFGEGLFWIHEWIETDKVAGDWGDAVYADHALTLIMPHLARRFPKEISFDAESARVAFWSSRAGRELDFRTSTLVNEHWKDWSERASGGAAALVQMDSNAQAAARTHDLWLMPRRNAGSTEETLARARAGTHRPLLQADPAWLCATEAMGWPIHPKDTDRHPEQEALISGYWERLMNTRDGMAFNGFIDWGRHPLIRGIRGEHFRLSHLVDYGTRTHVWGLYARSGERTYYDYGHGFNRFAGDWEMANWDTDTKFRGGMTFTGNNDYPLYWGDRTDLLHGVTGDDIANWALEYYMTGDVYAADRMDMVAEAFRKHWGPENMPSGYIQHSGAFAYLRRFANLYTWTGDEKFIDWARQWLDVLVDLDIPNAITDEINGGPFYKVDRNLLNIYLYYRVSGDETARKAFLQSLDYKYRFWRFRAAFSGQAYPALLYTIGYRWTGNPNYLRVVNYIAENGLGIQRIAAQGIHNNMHPTMALPAALALLTDLVEPIAPFPVVTQYREPEPTALLLRKPAGGNPVSLRLNMRMDDDFLEPAGQLFAWRDGEQAEPVDGLHLETELAFQPSSGRGANPRSWHVRATVSGNAPAGLYRLHFPAAEQVDVLESSASETSVYAPEGFRVRGDGVPDYFRVPEGQDTLEFFAGAPLTIRRPDGSVAFDETDGEIGAHFVPVNDRHGVWSVATARTAIFKVLSTEPVFARSAEWLVTGAGVEPEPPFKPPSDEISFVPAPVGQALHLPGGGTLRFSRGGPTGTGYERFPGAEGTVEFWFRPNWSSAALPFTMGRLVDRNFLQAGSHTLQYRRGQPRRGAPELASLHLWAYGERSNTGFTGRFWFQAGEWYHVVFCWRTYDGESGDDSEFAVFVNGDPVEADHFRRSGHVHFWPGRVSGGDEFHRTDSDETITIGAMDGTIGQFRISDTMRYEAPFKPLETLPEPDGHTLVQFRLDGDFKGETAEGRAVELKP